MMRLWICIFIGLSALAAPLSGCTSEAELPDGIAFFAEHGGGLYVLDSGTTDYQKIEVGISDVGGLAYSSKTQTLAFEARIRHEEPPSIYVLTKNRPDPERILAGTDDFFLYRPAFEPTGRLLYAVNYEDGIHRYSFDQESWEPVIVTGVEGLNPQGLAFSPSGDKVAISPGQFNEVLIGAVTENGLEITRRILDDFDSCISPRWVSETQIVFAGRKTAGLQYLWSIDLESGEVHKITDAPIGARDFLDLSPDRKRIVFSATNEDESLEWRLWQVELDGSNVEKLTSGGDLSSHLGPVHIY